MENILKNPGDAGAAPAIVWKESDGLKESEILFPFPENSLIMINGIRV